MRNSYQLTAFNHKGNPAFTSHYPTFKQACEVSEYLKATGFYSEITISNPNGLGGEDDPAHPLHPSYKASVKALKDTRSLYRVYGYEEDGTKWLLGTGTSHAEAIEIANLAAPVGIIETISIQLWRGEDE